MLRYFMLLPGLTIVALSGCGGEVADIPEVTPAAHPVSADGEMPPRPAGPFTPPELSDFAFNVNDTAMQIQAPAGAVAAMTGSGVEISKGDFKLIISSVPVFDVEGELAQAKVRAEALGKNGKFKATRETEDTVEFELTTVFDEPQYSFTTVVAAGGQSYSINGSHSDPRMTAVLLKCARSLKAAGS